MLEDRYKVQVHGALEQQPVCYMYKAVEVQRLCDIPWINRYGILCRIKPKELVVACFATDKYSSAFCGMACNPSFVQHSLKS